MGLLWLVMEVDEYKLAHCHQGQPPNTGMKNSLRPWIQTSEPRHSKLEYALHYPQRVSRMILVNPAPASADDYNAEMLVDLGMAIKELVQTGQFAAQGLLLFQLL